MAGTTSGTAIAMAATASTLPEMVTISTAGRLSVAKHKLFSAKGTLQRTRQHVPKCNGSVPNARLPHRGARECNVHNSSNNNRAGINNIREDTKILHKYNTVASVLSLPTTHIVGHTGMGLVHSITECHA